jgi:hypothetical protein
LLNCNSVGSNALRCMLRRSACGVRTVSRKGAKVAQRREEIVITLRLCVRKSSARILAYA